METMMFKMFTDYLSVEAMVLMAQLIVVGYVAYGIVQLLIKNFGEKWIAFRSFKSNLVLGLGTKITIEVARQQFTGHISHVSKDKIIISNDLDVVVMDIRTFMNSSIIIHNTNL